MKSKEITKALTLISCITLLFLIAISLTTNINIYFFKIITDTKGIFIIAIIIIEIICYLTAVTCIIINLITNLKIIETTKKRS